MRSVLENSCALILYRACLTCGTAAAGYRCCLAPSEPASSARRKSSGICMESPGARTAMGAAVYAGGAPAGHAKMRRSWYFRRRESCAKTCAKHAHMQHKLRTDAAPDDGCECGHSSALAVAVLQPSRLDACRMPASWWRLVATSICTQDCHPIAAGARGRAGGGAPGKRGGGAFCILASCVAETATDSPRAMAGDKVSMLLHHA